ncbi:MAG: HAMP domain-containing protein [Treponema sp.]|nr:HAMP domain-containing protein [Treponema sp.]
MKKIRIPISLQILFFLVVVAFIPIAAMMVLNTYEKQLLSLTENSNVQQARVLSASLSAFEDEEIKQEDAVRILEKMNSMFDSRIRILDEKGSLLADSSTLETNVPKLKPQQSRNSKSENQKEASETFVYRLFSLPIRLIRKFRPPVASYDSADYYSDKQVFDGMEIQQALKGNYGSATRISSGGQRSVTLYSAIPVFIDGNVKGVILVSRSTYSILQDLYELRVDLAKIFIWSMFVVGIIAAFLIIRIIHPVKKLSRQALNYSSKRNKNETVNFTDQKRNDEIGDLSRSFSDLVQKLDAKIRYTQAFSADVSHEFKNPLAAIRSSAELIALPQTSQEEKAEFTKSIIEEVSRLQNLLSGVRRISKIDGEGNLEEESFIVNQFAKNIVERNKSLFPDTTFSFSSEISDTETISMPSDWFDRMLQNLLENAASFADKVQLSIRPYKNKNQISAIIISVHDSGPGIQLEERDKIFNRFYSNRSDEQKGTHSGLGLSIVEAVTQAMGGSVTIEESPILSGALFSVTLPITKNNSTGK